MFIFISCIDGVFPFPFDRLKAPFLAQLSGIWSAWNCNNRPDCTGPSRTVCSSFPWIRLPGRVPRKSACSHTSAYSNLRRHGRQLLHPRIGRKCFPSNGLPSYHIPASLLRSRIWGLVPWKCPRKRDQSGVEGLQVSGYMKHRGPDWRTCSAIKLSGSIGVWRVCGCKFHRVDRLQF